MRAKTLVQPHTRYYGVDCGLHIYIYKQQFTKSSIQITKYYSSGCQMTGLVLHYIVVNKSTNIQISNCHL